MSTIQTFSAIRIIPRDTGFLDRRVGSLGEIFFDRGSNTLRIFDGDSRSGISLAKADLSNVSNSVFAAKAQSAGVGSGSGNTTVTVGNTLPQSPENGNLWLNTDTGILYVYINDGDSNQWIQPASPTFSGNYNDLTNKPTIPTVPTNVSEFTNDAGYITAVPPAISSTILAEDSTLLVDSEAGILNTHVLSQVSATNGQALVWNDSNNRWQPGDIELGSFAFVGSNIDTTDSSTITITPNVTLQSDLIVQNDIVANNKIFTSNIESDSVLNLSASSGVVITGSTTANNLTISGSTTANNLTISGSTIANNLTINGTTTIGQSVERMTTKTGITSTTDFDYEQGSVWFLYGINTNFTANFINVPSDTESSITIALIINQQATPYLPTAFEINGAPQTILWQGGSQPLPNADSTDVVSFTLIYTGSTWEILGSLTTYS